MVLLDAVLATCAPATVQVEAESELLRGTTVADWVGGGEHSDPVGPYWGLPPTPVSSPSWIRKTSSGSFRLPDVFAQFPKLMNL